MSDDDGGQEVQEEIVTGDAMDIERARIIGRRAAESSSRAARQERFSREFMVVTGVEGSSLTLRANGGGSIPGVPMTTACSGVKPGDVAVVDTYMHRPLAVGVLAG